LRLAHAALGLKISFAKVKKLGRVLALKLLFAALLPNVFFELATNGI
jgi:hypothetical protein